MVTREKSRFLGIVHPAGEPISPHLPRFDPFAVETTASGLKTRPMQQTRLVKCPR
jgi:hypothetical protein